MYAARAPWDIGRPQNAMIALEASGALEGSVLDAGCGTGEMALFLASRGHEVLGIDVAPRAIKRARAKAATRGLDAEFLVGDVLELESLGRTFDHAVDIGLFHYLAVEDRPQFAQSLAAAVLPGGTYATLCLSTHARVKRGPHQLSEAEIRGTFSGEKWRVLSIDEAELESLHGNVIAWLAIIERTRSEKVRSTRSGEHAGTA